MKTWPTGCRVPTTSRLTGRSPTFVSAIYLSLTTCSSRSYKRRRRSGSKVKANASKHKAMSYRRMKEEEKRLRKEIRELLAQAKKTDDQEDKRYGKDRRGDELPAELARREDRLRTIKAARQRLEARQREADREKGRDLGDQDRPCKQGKPFKRAFGEPEAKAQENFTDPDSRIMKRGSSGFEQCYNPQIAADEAAQIIVATTVTQSGSDVHQLEPLLDQIKETTGRYPERGVSRRRISIRSQPSDVGREGNRWICRDGSWGDEAAESKERSHALGWRGR